jgi:hypothetical protein
VRAHALRELQQLGLARLLRRARCMRAERRDSRGRPPLGSRCLRGVGRRNSRVVLGSAAVASGRVVAMWATELGEPPPHADKLTTTTTTSSAARGARDCRKASRLVGRFVSVLSWFMRGFHPLPLQWVHQGTVVQKARSQPRHSSCDLVVTDDARSCPLEGQLRPAAGLAGAPGRSLKSDGR